MTYEADYATLYNTFQFFKPCKLHLDWYGKHEGDSIKIKVVPAGEN